MLRPLCHELYHVLNFVSSCVASHRSSSDVALAVLHPSRLVVYSVNPVNIVQGRATFYELVKVYEHKLARIAFNMVAGQFGGVYGKISA